MKRFSVISISLIVLILLSPGFQSTAFAASLKGSLAGQHGATVIPNCPIPIKSSSIMPQCGPYPPCTKTGCYNVDPYNSGCAKAETYNHVTYVQTPFGGSFSGQPWLTYGYITNYYSSWCVANWVVVSLTTTGYNGSVTTGGIWITTTDTKGHNEKMCYPDSCGSYSDPVYPTWSNMIDGTNKTYAFVYARAGVASLDPFPAEADQ